MDGIRRDFAFAWRRLRASPVFTVFAVATLALGIGVTTSTYSIVRVVTGPPAGVRDVDRLVIINHTARGGSLPLVSLSWPDYQDYKQQQTTLEAVAAFTFFRQAFAANGLAETAFGEAVSGEYFQVLGVTATLGRVLTPLDDQASATPVAVISHGVWRRLFGGAPNVVGRAFRLNGNSFE